jgi:septal ring factor EnvC (AmiA/AmiB activator)
MRRVNSGKCLSSLLKVFFLFSLLGFFNRNSFAEDVDIQAITRRMNIISARTTALSRELNNLRSKRRSSLLAIDKVGKSLRAVSIRNDTLRAELQEHQQLIARAQKEEEGLVGEIAVLTNEVQQRLRAVYMSRKGGVEDLLVFNQRDRQMALFSPRELALWRKVFASDQQLFDLLEKKRRELIPRREKLNRERATLLALEAAIEKQAIELGRKRREQSFATARREAYEAKISQSLKMLRQEWNRLDGIIFRLTEGSPQAGVHMDPLSAPLGGEVDTKSNGNPDAKVDLISLPAIGRVVRPFGKRRVQEFDDVISNNGVELSVEEGSTVKAMRDGIVKFIGEMPNFGTVVVVDHGERLYSLYGRLKQLSVTVGANLKRGSSIGLVGKLNDRGSNFYFESRRAGRAIDPIGELGVPWG